MTLLTRAYRWTVLGLLAGALPAALIACSGPRPDADSATEASPETASAPAGAGAQSPTVLTINANGEDFVRQGFTTKDGWQISFDHVYVTLAEVTAYQSDPPYDPQDPNSDIKAIEQVSLDAPVTVDLASGDAASGDAAGPVKVGSVEAPPGHYNAFSWNLVDAPEGPAAGYSLVMQGTATKAGQSLPFTLKLAEELGFSCGDYVGEERKGILPADGKADLEATFHFDHLFGDGNAPAEDGINTGAVGFGPFAALAQGGEVVADSDALKTRMDPAEYQKLMEILPSLGHVGEGHCKETQLTS